MYPRSAAVSASSASLVICENADPTARADLRRFFEELAPEDGDYIHTADGTCSRSWCETIVLR
ncbi:MAG TPA: YjbQ family protein [Chthoniobacteraceae bacterium]|nr:YjbQ family protein [Chthoniobacteraceae bacterium]